MSYPNHAGGAGLGHRQDHETIDQTSPGYGVAVRDIFSDAAWRPAELVRARDWHDCGGRDCVQSETTFD